MGYDLKVFTENIEPEAVNQIYELIRTAPFEKAVNLGKQKLDLAAIDDHIRNRIPAGSKVHKAYTEDKTVRNLRCFKNLDDLDKLYRSMGTLGGGNSEFSIGGCLIIILLAIAFIVFGSGSWVNMLFTLNLCGDSFESHIFGF